MMSTVKTSLFVPCLFVSLLTANLAMAADDTRQELDAIAQQVHALDARYPVKGISTEQQAQSAIEESQNLQNRLQNWYNQSERHCYDIFFVNNCLREIKVERRQYLPTLQRISIEAKALQRQLRVMERDEELARKQAK
jgi:putative salt-induced outer membrane protein YdiY